ncbi:YebC/PmpR family DNA-binding transcriptional regulator [archaeon]|nr:MAG: YebC/PmpR family DNA-binding transcriptional regulator [archaeon]
MCTKQAAKAGGADPSINPELARILKEAHSIKLPKDNIDRALSKAKDTSTEAFTAGVYEVFGFGGAGLVVCSLTDNPTRAVKEIKTLVRKSDVKIASAGSVLFNFEQKAVFHAQQEYNKDELLDKALELDMSDIQFIPHIDHPVETIVAKVEELGLLQDLTSSLTGSTSLAYIPVETVAVSEADKEKNREVIEAFEDLQDVDAVYHNMQSS